MTTSDTAAAKKISSRLHALTSQRMIFLAIAFLVGLAVGTAAFFLKSLIRWISLPLLPHLHYDGPNYLFILYPVVGIMLTVIYQRYVLHQGIYHGVERLRKSLAERNYNMSPRLILAPIIASSLTLGFGGSAGSEGPIASSGAAIGSNIGRWFKLTETQVMVMIACGAGAGIAGIFKAPVGGALFTIEILALPLDALALIALFISTLTSALTAYVWSGCTPDVTFTSIPALNWTHVIPVILLGLFTGIYSAYYAIVMKKMTAHYNRMKNHWVKNISSGLTVGILLFLFPTLYGEGYGAVAKLLADVPHTIIDYTWLTNIFKDYASGQILLMSVALAMLLAKPFATSSTNGGGGVAGDFAPTIMIGSVAGFLYAAGSNYFFGTHLPVVDFVFLGTTGVMAGAIGAPCMAIMITVEMATAYPLLLPATAVATLSYLTKRLLTTNYHDYLSGWN
ncbi:MAG: chloride channel protein [Bacteroides sp.]|nr:chloride channel protein [Bacteroides sp.]